MSNNLNRKTALPTMLSYKRSISQGRALMYAAANAKGDGAVPVLVEPVGVRGTKAFDFWAKIEKDKKKDAVVVKGIETASTPNPQRIEAAFLPEDKPFLKVSFDVKYYSNAAKPYMSNLRDVDVILRNFVKNYARLGGFDFLAKKYVVPLVTGMWMWRNNDEAISKKVFVSVKVGAESKVFEFSPSYNAFSFDSLSRDDQLSALELASLIGKAHAGEIPLLVLNVVAVYEIGGGSIVYPSQEMITDDRNSDPENKVSRILYKVSHSGLNNHAAIHEQKIGNALRCIDDMHEDEMFGPQAIEPLGVVSTHLTSTRIGSKRDFYTLIGENLSKWNDELSAASELSEIKTAINDLHYCVAVLIRGGAFV